MEELFKGIDDFEREFVGYHVDHDHNKDDGLWYCKDSIYAMMIATGMLDDERQF